jgi:hypothetical protein
MDARPKVLRDFSEMGGPIVTAGRGSPVWSWKILTPKCQGAMRRKEPTWQPFEKLTWKRG